MLIDSHAHPHFKEYDRDRDQMLSRAFDEEISIVAIGTDIPTSKEVVKLAQKYPGKIYATIGHHPNNIISEKTTNISKYKNLLAYDEVVAVGEVGLDYYRLEATPQEKRERKSLQQSVFAAFVDLAKEAKLPLVIHTRCAPDNTTEALNDVIKILENKDCFKGVVHCYGGTLEQAKILTEKGMYLGITGIVTFKNAELLRQVVMEIPLENLLVETDSPFLSPEPYRGKRNEPAYVKFVAQKVAELKELSTEEVERQTIANTKTLFNV